MSTTSTVRTKAGKLEHVRGAKVMKATDHSKWHRQQQRHGLSTSSPIRPSVLSTLNGTKLDSTSSEKQEKNSPEDEVDRSPHPEPTTRKEFSLTDAESLRKLLANPIMFRPASNLTLKDEQRTKTRIRRPQNGLSDEHRLRQKHTSLITKTWPRLQAQSTSVTADTKSTRPLGLDNPHNFCYRRSVLQAFLHLPVLSNWLQQIQEFHARSGTHDDRIRCLACDFHHLSRAIRSRNRKNSQIRLRQFDLAMRALGPKQKQYTWLLSSAQADAHEFLLFVIDAYQDLLKLPAPVVTGLFKLQVLSQWTCADCHAIHTASPVDETGISVSLRKDKGTLRDYIRAYFHDTVEDARCDNPLCQSKSNRTRTRTINAAPACLFVQLARFEQHYDRRTGKFRASKDSRPVAYERELDLGEFAVVKGQSLRYRLSSVVAHAGSLHGGHYIAFAEKEGGGGCMEFNDDAVREVQGGKLLNPGGGFTPYILTYVACEATD